MNVETFLQADRLRHDAFIAGDTDVLNRLMADECLYIHTTGNIDRKDELINKIASRALIYHAIENSVDHAILYENNTAIIAGRLRMSLERTGIPAAVHIRYCCAWKHDTTGPQMISWQSTPLAAS
ncbi:nuclear transport factor 2 family protein [Brucella pituitosa]|uniref:Nuclear transport factor 2 family protein n=1 Tax=Brucella pituitosa TaxID=571256 RepID=A0A643ET59_9HYPH|nr:nuclear transport factor 2 family protein [Brucella pituitosa]KAB0565574.1 nuclear transport factor 2 family protein [Brucella pituitosa]PRA53005.1 hypothetical protein CQ062_16225 [Ochrobactrum sp. MYb68]